MLAHLVADFPIIMNLFERASVVLNYDLYDLVANGPTERLNQTVHTQPALLIANHALYLIHKQRYGIKPCYFAGHSLGEYSALVASHALSFEEAVFLVAKRAELMQTIDGAMAAVMGCTFEQLTKLCQEVTAVSVASYNSPSQLVIAGEMHGVNQVSTSAKAMGAKVRILPISVPAHCDLMQDVASQFTEHLHNTPMLMPQTEVISNVTASPHLSIKTLKQDLVRHLHQPVQWYQSIAYLQQHVSIFIECGPGKVLAGLNKRIGNSIQTLSGEDLKQMDTFYDH